MAHRGRRCRFRRRRHARRHHRHHLHPILVETALDAMVVEFKAVVADKCEVSVAQQRLIYKGRILKDDQTLASYDQDAFKVPLVIQLTDDEKYFWKDVTVEEIERLSCENARDIIACGFDITRSFIFSDFNVVGRAFYRNMARVAKCVKFKQVDTIIGFKIEDHVGKISFPPIQATPSFRSSFPHLFSGDDDIRCLMPCAIDQI